VQAETEDGRDRLLAFLEDAYPESSNRPGNALPFHPATGQPLRDRDRFVTGEGLGSAELDEVRRVGFYSDGGDHPGGVIDRNPPVLGVALAEHGHLATGDVEPPSRGQMDLLEGIRPHDDRPHRRRSKQPLDVHLGPGQRSADGVVHARYGHINEPRDPLLLGGLDQRGHTSLVDIADRGLPAIGESPADHRGRSHDRLHAGTGRGKTRVHSEVSANHLDTLVPQRSGLGIGTNQAPNGLPGPNQMLDDATAQLTGAADHQDHDGGLVTPRRAGTRP
jgi:hypothetical protein